MGLNPASSINNDVLQCLSFGTLRLLQEIVGSTATRRQAQGVACRTLGFGIVLAGQGVAAIAQQLRYQCIGAAGDWAGPSGWCRDEGDGVDWRGCIGRLLASCMGQCGT